MVRFRHLMLLRLRTLQHATFLFFHDSKLRMAVIGALLALFWALMFAVFLDVFMFIRGFQEISGILLDYLFAFFFLALLVMMAISNGIISYTSLYRTEETEFLITLPSPAEHIFVYRTADSIVFSLWGMLTLVVPMILAYGMVFGAPLYYYAISLTLAFLLLVLAGEMGAFCALMVAVFLPRRRKTVLGLLAAGCVLAGLLWSLPLWRETPEEMFTDQAIRSIMDRIAFCQHWALPSLWVAKGMLSAGRGAGQTAGALILTLLANVLFLGVVIQRMAFYLYRRSWDIVQGGSVSRTYRPGGLLDTVVRTALVFLPLRLRELVLKDLKTFLRDPAQWSQFLLFFGLLGLYILNLPRFGVESLEAYWHSIISTLNLGATCLTLATLTTRFVFPQLSLEGRRIWITGLVPMPRTMIMWGKFIFATAGTFVVSGLLIALSDLMLGLPLWVLAIHMLVVACVCCGLNGLAVGLGALYPRRGTDNPSKIVSSFGGTLNLVCSICFIVLALAPVVVPLHLNMVGAWGARMFVVRLSIGLAIVLVSSAAASVLPMWAGTRAFSRMEF